MELGLRTTCSVSPSVAGPGLGVRVLGGSEERVLRPAARRADAIFIEELRKADLCTTKSVRRFTVFPAGPFRWRHGRWS